MGAFVKMRMQVKEQQAMIADLLAELASAQSKCTTAEVGDG